MTTAVETGHGSEFWLDNASNVSTLLGEVVTVPIPNGAAELIQASHMGSVNFHDYIQSPLRDGEEAEIEMNWVPGSATDDLCIEARGKTRDFQIVLPVGEDTYEITGQVLVRDYIRVNPMSDKRTGTLVVKWVGDPTEALVPAP